MAAAIEAEKASYQKLLKESCLAASNDPSTPACSVLGSRLGAYLDYFLPAYCKAELSAQHHQQAYTRASTAVFTLSAMAIIIVAAQHLFHLPHLLVTGEIFCIGLILAIFHWGNHRRWHRNWVDCRYFAERVRCGLNVAFLCGRSSVPDSFQLATCFVEGSWCNREFQKMMRARPHPEPLEEKHIEVLRHFMATNWLKDQENHHIGVAVDKIARHKLVSRLGETCFWLTLVTAFLHLTPHSWRHALHVENILTDNFLTFIVIALPAVGTALAGVRGHFEFKKISTRSRMIAGQIHALVKEAETVENLDGLGLMVLRAEELMIQENAGWHLHTGDKVMVVE